MMLRSLLAGVAALALAGVGACAPEQYAAVVRAEIEAQAAAWEAAYDAGDAAAVAALYTEDALLMAPGMESLAGREAIAALWQGAMDGGLARVDLVTEEVYPGVDIATEVGRAIIFDAAGNSPGSSKYIVVWKKTADGWRLHRDLWNENQVPPPNDAMPEGAE